MCLIISFFIAVGSLLAKADTIAGLYTVNYGGPHANCLARIDPTTGVGSYPFNGELLDTSGWGVTPQGLAYDSQDGFLYTVNYGGPHANCLARIDPMTGVGSYPFNGELLDTSGWGVSPQGLAYDSQDGFLYTVNYGGPHANCLARIDPMTGVGSYPFNGELLDTSGWGVSPQGLAYDSQDGFLTRSTMEVHTPTASHALIRRLAWELSVQRGIVGHQRLGRHSTGRACV